MEQFIQLQLEDDATNNLYPALFQCFTIIICGYVAGRLGLVSSVEAKGIGTFVGTFALPSLIFLSLARLDFSVVNWMFLFSILLAKSIIFFTVIIATLLVSKPVNLGRAGIFAIFCTQSNDFALGYPIIKAIYEKDHPEYALYLYLMAPISLAVLNPVAFVLMEINKQRNETHTASQVSQITFYNKKLFKQILKGIAFNPVLVMTVLGILGNIIFQHQLSVYIEALLETFGQAFSATALFLLGLRMVGQIHRLRGPALLLPCVLIMMKLIILPVAMRESVSVLNAGGNETATLSLSTYAFLYGTIPTAPAVFVFSNLYQLEIDLMASSMVICTFLSAPIMYLSAQMIAIDKDYAPQLKTFGYDLSIVSLAATLWTCLLLIVTKKYQRVPHKLTSCLAVTQVLLSVSVVWGGAEATPPQSVLQQALLHFTMYSSLLWTSMLSFGLVMLQSRGASFVTTIWPVLAFVAWGAPAAVLGAVFLASSPLNAKTIDAIRLCLLVFCLTVSSGCLMVYVRHRRRTARPAPNETTSLVNGQGSQQPTDRYGAVKATASVDAGSINSDQSQTKLINTENDVENEEVEDGNNSYGRQEDIGRGSQLLKHTVLLIVYNLTMFIGIAYTTWRMVIKDESGLFVEIEFLDIAANYGQGLVMFVLFGLDAEEVFRPTVRYLKSLWYGTDRIVLPPVEELDFETRHVCEQFIAHHLESCKEAICENIRCGMRTRRGAFRGTRLAAWLVGRGVAADAEAAVQYARRLLAGRVIAHVAHEHHFHDSDLLYTFNAA